MGGHGPQEVVGGYLDIRRHIGDVDLIQGAESRTKEPLVDSVPQPLREIEDDRLQHEHHRHPLVVGVASIVWFLFLSVCVDFRGVGTYARMRRGDIEIDDGEGGGDEAVGLDGLVLLLVESGDAFDVVADVVLGRDQHARQGRDQHAQLRATQHHRRHLRLRRPVGGRVGFFFFKVFY